MGQASPIHSPLQSMCVIGKDSKGHWVVQGPKGRYGGLFVSRVEALRFAMRESGDAVVMVPGTFELNTMQWT
jgi:hypothetical protein